MTTQLTTGTSSTTWTYSVPCGGEFPDDQPCMWQEMHHLDDEGRHWCPTGFIYCHQHGGIGTIEGPAQCQLWGDSG